MPTVWRIVKGRHAASAFDGEGARLFGGRWNSPGLPAVYASETRALAMLEILAGLRETRKLSAYVLVRARFDDATVDVLDPDTLPEDWRSYPPPPTVRALGDRWLTERAALALRVPSVLVPSESNYLLNPRCPDFARIEIGEPEPIDIDARLLS